MTKTARSIFAFGVYLLPLGLLVMLAPNFFLSLFFVAPTSEVWIRVMGMLIIWLAIFYCVTGQYELRPLFIWTVRNRVATFLILGTFVVLGIAPVQLVTFGFADLFAALWTWSLMRREV
jgi:hypothetical protein